MTRYILWAFWALLLAGGLATAIVAERRRLHARATVLFVLVSFLAGFGVVHLVVGVLGVAK